MKPTVAALLLSTLRIAAAAVFYIDPQSGDGSGDGSSSNPWGTLRDVVEAGLIETRQWDSYPCEPGVGLVAKNAGAPVKAGDTLLLRSGYHGDVTISKYYNAQPITIAAQSGHEPALKRLRLQACSGWNVRGLTISPESAPAYETVRMLHIESHGYSGPSREITVESCRLFSVDDASGWSETYWDSLSCNAVLVSGNQCTIRNNHCRNVNFGISVSGDSCLIEGNVVENFAGDGLRGLGDDLTFRYNTVKNCYDVNSNHDDGFQSWSSGPDGVGTGTVYRLKLIGNTIINYTNPNQPFRGTLQGIGCFDGMFEGWIVSNNVVIVDHWHGITLSGARNCHIVNNTVYDITDSKPGPAWIRIGAHKDGTPSSGCIVRNNLAQSFQVDDSYCSACDHNLEFDNPASLFVDLSSYDMRLKPGCAAIDAGTEESAPNRDIAGTVRPQGEGVDIGAYEYVDTSAPVMPGRYAFGGRSSHTTLTVCRRAGTVHFELRGILHDSPPPLRLHDMRGTVITRLNGISQGAVIRYRMPTRPASVRLFTARAGTFSGTIVLP